jgi:hypothetical protein
VIEQEGARRDRHPTATTKSSDDPLFVGCRGRHSVGRRWIFCVLAFRIVDGALRAGQHRLLGFGSKTVNKAR